jgi:hypothetical protein
MTLRRLLSFGILFLAVSTSLFAQTAPAKHSPRKKTKAKAAPVVPPAPAVIPPGVSPVPLTLAQKPAIAPRVQYQNGILTIVAENSTLGDILRAVHQQSGAIVDLPPNATERVVANLGPGPARDVLAALLNGSNFNYVMLGSEKDPNDVQHLIVTSKSGGESGEIAKNAPQPGFNGRTPVAPPNGPVVTGGAADSGGDADADDSASDDQPQADDQVQEGPNEPHESPANGQGIKTPEQLLQELQRQQQMQQQQQPPQSAPQGFPPPPQNPEPQD